MQKVPVALSGKAPLAIKKVANGAFLGLGTPVRRLWLLLALALLASGLFMTIDVQAEWSFVLPLRGTKLATLWAVAFAIGISTVLFQTVTGNRILTPAVMGLGREQGCHGAVWQELRRYRHARRGAQAGQHSCRLRIAPDSA